MLIARLKNLMVLDIQMILFKQSYLFHDEHNHQQLDLIVVIRFSFKVMDFHLNRFEQSCLSRVCHIQPWQDLIEHESNHCVNEMRN